MKYSMKKGVTLDYIYTSGSPKQGQFIGAVVVVIGLGLTSTFEIKYEKDITIAYSSKAQPIHFAFTTSSKKPVIYVDIELLNYFTTDIDLFNIIICHEVKHCLDVTKGIKPPTNFATYIQQENDADKFSYDCTQDKVALISALTTINQFYINKYGKSKMKSVQQQVQRMNSLLKKRIGFVNKLK
ncbi:MAG: hypothetical protein KQ78_00212 [Candidatus Izimaplasma bacterium HR2]|nr:MAG: hypothetical protein KQ78_00212 [Candidatus Izimaplasma bacterium HR2]